MKVKADVDFNKQQLVNKQETAKFLNISLSKLAYLTNPNHKNYDPDFPKPIHIGKAVRYYTAALLAYIARN